MCGLVHVWVDHSGLFVLSGIFFLLTDMQHPAGATQTDFVTTAGRQLCPLVFVQRARLSALRPPCRICLPVADLSLTVERLTEQTNAERLQHVCPFH